MPSCDPETTTISITDVTTRLPSLVPQILRGRSRVLVEDSGSPVAAIVSIEDLELLKQLDRRREAFFERVDRLQEAFKDVPPEEIERETDRIIARNRAADRAAREELAPSR